MNTANKRDFASRGRTAFLFALIVGASLALGACVAQPATGEQSRTAATRVAITPSPAATVQIILESADPTATIDATPTAASTAAPTASAAPTPTAAPTASPTRKATPKPIPKPKAVDPYAEAKAAGATAVCADKSWSFSAHRSGTCSHHGGVHWWTGNLGPAGPGTH